jgi:hypothetical protein
MFKHEPRDNENLYLILDAEVWCSDVVAQRWVIDLADQLELNHDRMVKMFMFVSTTKDPVPEKVAGLFEIIEDVYPLDAYKCASRMYESLTWGEVPSEEDCIRIFKGMTKYQIETAITRAFMCTRTTIPQEASYRQPNRPADQMGLVTQAVADLLGLSQHLQFSKGLRVSLEKETRAMFNIRWLPTKHLSGCGAGSHRSSYKSLLLVRFQASGPIDS